MLALPLVDPSRRYYMVRKFVVGIMLLVIAGGISACSPGGERKLPGGGSNLGEINSNSRFRGFYEDRGGLDVFGPF